MLISKRMNAALNEQVGNEFSASMQYVAIAAYFETEGLSELGTKFHAQAAEERDHALRFVRYVIAAGGKVAIPAIPAPKNEFMSAEEAVGLSLKSEETVTKQINKLVDLAIEESDHTSRNFLGWFVNEQLEEVSSMDNLLRLIRRAGEENLVYVEAVLARGGAKGGGDAGGPGL